MTSLQIYDVVRSKLEDSIFTYQVYDRIDPPPKDFANVLVEIDTDFINNGGINAPDIFLTTQITKIIGIRSGIESYLVAEIELFCI